MAVVLCSYLVHCTYLQTGRAEGRLHLSVTTGQLSDCYLPTDIPKADTSKHQAFLDRVLAPMNLKLCTQDPGSSTRHSMCVRRRAWSFVI